MAKNNSKDINFQYYIDAVKQKKIHWHIFVGLIQDVSYSDLKSLKILNAILLTELTMNCSDLDKLKYLNVLLLSKFKKHILRENGLEMKKDDFLQDLQQEESDINKTSQEISIDNEIQMSTTSFENNVNNSLNKDSNVSPIMKEETSIDISTDVDDNDEIKNSTFDHILNEDTSIDDSNKTIESAEATGIEMSTDNEIQTLPLKGITDNETQLQIVNEIEDNITSSCKEETFDHNPSTKIFICHICKKHYSIHFYLKQHLKKVHEKKKKHNFHQNQNDYKCEECGKSFSSSHNLKRHIHTIHDE